MDLTARPVLIGLSFIIAVCGVVVLWGSATALRLWTLSNAIWVFRPMMATVRWKLCSLQYLS